MLGGGTMRAKAFGIALILAGGGCDSDPPPRRVTEADITPIPSGTATGSLFSGDYVITGGAIEACLCRFGSCGTLHIGVGGAITVVHTDGAFQLGSPNALVAVCVGGVDSDGSFRCNGSLVQPDLVEYTVATGRIQAPNGQPTALTSTLETTHADPAYDCDLRATATAQYFGPPAAWEATGPAAAFGFSLLGL